MQLKNWNNNFLVCATMSFNVSDNFNRQAFSYLSAKALNKSTKTFELGWNIVFEERMYE